MTGPDTDADRYRVIKVDSGYLSDMVESAKRSVDAQTALFASTSSSGSVNFTTGSFDDTQWEVSRGNPSFPTLNRESKKLEKQIRKPRYFPIVPLQSTLDRARKEAAEAREEATRVKKDVEVVPKRIIQRESSDSDKPKKTYHTAAAPAVDGYGRTRAATKMYATAKATENGARTTKSPWWET